MDAQFTKYTSELKFRRRTVVSQGKFVLWSKDESSL